MVACVDRLLPFLPFDLSSASCISGRDGGSARERFWPSFSQAGTSFCGGARPAFTGPFQKYIARVERGVAGHSHI